MADRDEDTRAAAAYKIAELIAAREPSVGEVTAVARAIEHLSHLAENEKAWPTRVEQREKLSRVAKLAAELCELLGEPLGILTARARGIETAADTTRPKLRMIADEFAAAANAIPKGRGRAGRVPNPDGDNTAQATARKVVEIFTAIRGAPLTAHAKEGHRLCELLFKTAGGERSAWSDTASGWRPHVERARGRVSDADIATTRAQIATIDFVKKSV